jgi:ribosomal protein S18 acetylase RimI-like enzyme
VVRAVTVLAVQADELTGRKGARTAGAVLGRAFLEDPVWSWVVQGRRREPRLRAAFTCFAATVVRTPGCRVLVTPGRTAAALWLPPGGWPASLVEQVRTAPRSALGLRGGVLRGLRLQAVLDRHHPREPHWYLEALGAVPSARGTGVGGLVVVPVLEACDRDGLPAYLESSNPRNWSFYERLGFVRREPLPVPAGCPPLMPMWRDPR